MFKADSRLFSLTQSVQAIFSKQNLIIYLITVFLLLPTFAIATFQRPEGDVITTYVAMHQIDNPLVFFTGNTTLQPEYYRPLPFLAFWIFYRVFGVWLIPSVLLSFLIHCFNVYVLLRLITLYQSDRIFAFVTLMLYTISVYTIDAMTWVVAINGLMVGSFLLLLLLHLAKHEMIHTPLKLWYIGLVCVGALMCKESGLIVPAVAGFASLEWRNLRRSKFALAGLSAGIIIAYFLMRYAMFGVFAGGDASYEMSPIILFGGADLTTLPPTPLYKMVGHGEIVAKYILATILPIFSNQGTFFHPYQIAQRLLLWIITPVLLFFSSSQKLSRLQVTALLIIVLNALIHFSFFSTYLMFMGQIGLAVFIGASPRLRQEERLRLITALGCSLVIAYSLFAVNYALTRKVLGQQNVMENYAQRLNDPAENMAGVERVILQKVVDHYGSAHWP